MHVHCHMTSTHNIAESAHTRSAIITSPLFPRRGVGSGDETIGTIRLYARLTLHPSILFYVRSLLVILRSLFERFLEAVSLLVTEYSPTN